jgi:DNA polymerase elongation subunit (family B)
MPYVDAYHNKDNDEIWIVERINGERTYQTLPSKYTFYFEDQKGKYQSIFGDRVSKYTTNNYSSFQKELKVNSGRKLFESDINPIFRCLEENYLGAEAPELHVGLFDIEVGFDPDRGFAPPDDPHSPITAITIHMNWADTLVTLALPPETLSFEQAQQIADQFDNTYIFEREEDLLESFLDLIDDVDVLSGWNSTGFDIPYIVRRVERILGKDYTRKMCLWNLLPKRRTYEKFKKEHITYDLIGRVHLDYLDLFMKHSMQQLHSYRLDYVAELEVGENKTPYDGTLDELYKNDFTKFIEYNRQDVDLLVRIDAKKKYIDLANQLAHTNTVQLQTTMGSVALIEQAIINEAHRRNMVVPNKKPSRGDDDEETMPVVGAYVADPKVGLHQWIGSVDINSLYPSVIRSLNMGPETVVGQLRPDYTKDTIKERAETYKSATEAWHDIFGSLEYSYMMEQDNTKIMLDMEDGSEAKLNAKDIYDWVFNPDNKICISANGTVFRTDVEGVIPGLLERWYSERKQMQGKQKDFGKQAAQATDSDTKKELEQQEAFWNQRQHARKILLNSLYGALLNPFCRFFDQRIGQSVTLTGRAITRHMIAQTNQIIAGEYDHKGEAIIYGDTDSAYFSAYPVMKDDPGFKDFEWNEENVIALYNQIGDAVNETFTEFMMNSFNTSEERGSVIKAAREVCGKTGLFITKKRYAILVYDDEGKRKDKDDKPGEIKAMGLDLKRSDTPKTVQKFLESLLMEVLTNKGEDEIIEFIKGFRGQFKDMPSWEKGTPKRVNALTDYAQRQEKYGKINMPGHVRASLNWNNLLKTYGDNYSMPIPDGGKIIVCKLKPNPLKMTSIAYPIDEPHVPKWFKKLPFDDEAMEETLIDQKVSNLISVLDIDLSKAKNDTTFGDLFDI